jgi:predicted kinase
MVDSAKSFWSVALTVTIPISAAVIFFNLRRKNGKGAPEKTKSFTVVEEKSGSSSINHDSEVMGTWTSLGLEQPLVIAMVGLPARGKSYLVKMIIRYLKWTGFEAEVFNVGSYRRKIGHASADSSFFSSNNPDAKRLREDMAMTVQDDMYIWLRKSEGSKGRVAIFDATNTTKSRRVALAQRSKKENVFLLFVESICDDVNVLRRNYELKLQNDDYKEMDKELAMKDFLSRVEAYEKVYEVSFHFTGYLRLNILFSDDSR